MSEAYLNGIAPEEAARLGQFSTIIFDFIRREEQDIELLKTPELNDLLKELSKDYKLVLVANKAFEGFRDRFDHIFTEEILGHEFFVRCAEEIGVRIDQCIAIEYSQSGVEAAARAGMTVVAVASEFNEDELKNADHIVKTVEEIKEVIDSYAP